MTPKYYLENERKLEIRRKILLICSYIDECLGFIHLFIAIVINHDGISSNDGMVGYYAIMGVIIWAIGQGGVYYESIITARIETCRGNVYLHG